MKPKKQIDFLVEDFFNTGKIELNKDEVGITFDQLLVETKYGHLVGKEFVHHNPKDNRVGTFTITKIDDKNNEDAYVTVLDSSDSTKNYNLRFLVVNSPDLQNALKRNQINNFIPPLVPWLTNKLSTFKNQTQLKRGLSDLKKELSSLGYNIEDDNISTIIKDKVEERINQLVQRTSLSKEINKYKEVKLSDEAKEILSNWNWKKDDVYKIEKDIEVLEDELKELTQEEKKIDKNIPHNYKKDDNKEREEVLGSIRNDIWDLKQAIESKKDTVVKATAASDPHYLFANIFIENCCYTKILLDPSINKELFNGMVEIINQKYQEGELFKFIRSLKSAWREEGMEERNIKLTAEKINSNIVNTHSPIHQLSFKFCNEDCETEEVNIDNFNDLYKNTKYIIRSRSAINKQLPVNYSEKIEGLIEKALHRVNDIFNLLTQSEIFVQEAAYRKRYENLIQMVLTYAMDDDYAAWEEKYKKSNRAEQIYMIDEVEGALTEVVYGLMQMQLLMEGVIQNPDIKNNNVLKLINNALLKVNDASTIQDNLAEIRKNNSLLYEKSFAKCKDINGNPYFNYTTDGDRSTVVGGSQIIPTTNQWLTKRLDDIINRKKSVKDTINEIYKEINDSGIAKYDIITKQDVNLTSQSTETLITIPIDKKIEVKKSNKYEYHLSEFFGVYKKSNLDKKYKSLKYKSIYNQIINGVIKKLKKGDKGIIEKLRDTTYGVFFDNDIFYKLEDMELKWSSIGQRNTEARMTITMKPKKDAIQYQWTPNNGNCNCEPFLKGVECEENMDKPLDNYISEALGF